MKRKELVTSVEIYTFDELPHEEQQLIDAAKKACSNSYAPYSNFHVGVALLLQNKVIITGNNQENAAYPSGLCAERVAVFYANATYPNIPIKTIAIIAQNQIGFIKDPISPCGACRQVLIETEKRFKSPIRLLLAAENTIYIFKKASVLLPFQFDDQSLS